MTKTAQRILEELYKASQEEREELRKINDIKLAESKQKTLMLNDFDRTELADTLMHELSIKSKLDYFHAAMIYSRGETTADYKKAHHYAEQALNLSASNDLSEEINQQLRFVYELSFDNWQISEGRKPKYGSNKNSKTTDVKEDKNKSSAPIPGLTPPPDSEKAAKEKKKKEEEELEANQIICNNCGKKGHSSASCFKPKK